MLLALTSLLVCALALTVSAAGSASDAYGEITVIDGEAEPSVIDSGARVVYVANDGTYYTFPAYYVIVDQETFAWRSDSKVNEILGYSGQKAQDIRNKIVRFELPEGVTALNPTNTGGATVFEDATSMVEIKLPSTLVKIGSHTFNRCRSLVVIDGLLEFLAKETTTTLGEQMVAETLWGEGVDLVIPANVTVIPTRCFYGTKINSVTFHDGVTTLGARSFERCPNITSVTLTSGITRMENHVFASCSSLASVDTSACTGLTSIGNYCFEKTKLTSFDFTPFAASFTALGDGILNNCTSLTTVTGFELLDNITTVPVNTFNFCPLSAVNFPKNITSIGSYAYFQHKSMQTEVRIPNSVTSIGDHALVRDKSVAAPEGVRIYLPASLTTVTGSYNFEYWHFAEMYIPATFALSQGFTNGTLTKGVVYYYVGDKDTLSIHATHNAAILDAEWVSVDEFTGASPDKNYVVYGYSECDAFYMGHSMTGSANMQKGVDYFSAILFTDVCSVCGTEVVDESLTIGALFISKGVSAKTFGTDIGLVQGYEVNMASVEAYKAYVPDFNFGVLAYANIGGTAVSPKPGDDKVVDVVFDNAANNYLEVKVTGIPAEYLNASIVFCVYVTEGEKFYYLDNGTTAEGVLGHSYNGIIG